MNFDIQLNDITWTNYPVLATVGLFNLDGATNAGFSRNPGCHNAESI